MKGWLKEILDFRFDSLLREVEMSVLLDQQTLFMYVPFHSWRIIGNNYGSFSKRRLDHATLLHSISDQAVLFYNNLCCTDCLIMCGPHYVNQL